MEGGGRHGRLLSPELTEASVRAPYHSLAVCRDEISWAGIDNVPARAAIHGVLSPIAGHDDQVRPVPAPDSVLPTATNEKVRVGGAVQAISACPAEDVVPAIATPDAIGTRTTTEGVRPAPASDLIVTRVALYAIGARAGMDDIVPAARIDDVVSGERVDRVGYGGPFELVVASGPGDRGRERRRGDEEREYDATERQTEAPRGQGQTSECHGRLPSVRSIDAVRACCRRGNTVGRICGERLHGIWRRT
jgi:hypothetical protein